jgi:hypothetical protein
MTPTRSTDECTFNWSVRICWVKDEVHDSMTIYGDSLEDLQRKAADVVEKRSPDDYWSENLVEPT